MIQYRTPVRINTVQQIDYTFKDQAKQIIDLTGFVTAWLEVKQQGQMFSTVAATILSPRSSGQVQVDSYTFTQAGIWDIQFYLVDGTGKKVFGEPLQFRAVINVEDVALNDLMPY